eukprot:3213468-Amphidinium_carterae.1
MTRSWSPQISGPYPSNAGSCPGEPNPKANETTKDWKACLEGVFKETPHHSQRPCVTAWRTKEQSAITQQQDETTNEPKGHMPPQHHV